MKLIFKQDNLCLQTFNSSVQTTSVWISRLTYQWLLWRITIVRGYLRNLKGTARQLSVFEGYMEATGHGLKKEEIKNA